MSFFKKLSQIIHSENLVGSCAGRFFLYLALWAWQAFDNIRIYSDTMQGKLGLPKWYVQGWLSADTQMFFIPLLVLWAYDAVWVYRKINYIPIEEYKHNAVRKKYVVHSLQMTLIPFIPFYTLFPILYYVVPDIEYRNIFLTIQWWPIAIAGSVIPGILLSAAVTVAFAVVYFVVPFYVYPALLVRGRKFCTRRKIRRLRSLYCKRSKLVKKGVSFYYASDTKYRKPLKNAVKIFNKAFRNVPELQRETRVGIFLAPETEPEPVSAGTGGFFTVIGYRVTESADALDSVVTDECLKAILAAFEEVKRNSADFPVREAAECLLDTADCYFPKYSGLKRKHLFS